MLSDFDIVKITDHLYKSGFDGASAVCQGILDESKITHILTVLIIGVDLVFFII